MNKRYLVTALSMLLCASAHAAPVFEPIDTTVNFIDVFGDTATLIGVFDDGDPSYAGDYLAVQASGDQIVFTPQGADYSLVNVSGIAPAAFVLTGSDRFTLAAWSPVLSAWLAPDAIICSALSGSCALAWSGMLIGLAVDVAEVESFPAIPLPMPGYLLASGALGLVAVARRRSSAQLSAAG